jgi:eukaryotic-like serine/threonine-protein kinase
MVAHEALLRVWPRVVKWVRDNRDFLRQRARLSHALEQWKTRERHEDYLLARGLPLAEAESLLKQHEAALGEDEVAYICASRAKAQRDELRRKKVRRAVMAG